MNVSVDLDWDIDLFIYVVDSRVVRLRLHQVLLVLVCADIVTVVV